MKDLRFSWWFQAVVLWVVALCNDVVGYQHSEGSMVIQNASNLPYHYMVLVQKTQT